MQTDLNIRVLTDDFLQRLATMNHVSRQLRRLGYRVRDEQDATITLDLDTHPLQRKRRRQHLLRLGRGCLITTLSDGSKRYLTHVCGVDVTWREAA